MGHVSAIKAWVEGWSGNTSGLCFTLPEVRAGDPPRTLRRCRLWAGISCRRVVISCQAELGRLEKGHLFPLYLGLRSVGARLRAPVIWRAARVGHPIIRTSCPGRADVHGRVHSVSPMVVIPPVHAKVLGGRAGPGRSLARLRDSPWGWTKQPLTDARGAPPGARIRHNVRLGPAQSPLRHWVARERPAISAAFLHDAQHAEHAQHAQHAQLPPSPDGRGQEKPKSHPRTWPPPTARRVKPSGRWINPQPASLGPGHEWWRRRRHQKQGRRRHLRNNPPAPPSRPGTPRTLAPSPATVCPRRSPARLTQVTLRERKPNTCRAGSHIAGASRSISRRGGEMGGRSGRTKGGGEAVRERRRRMFLERDDRDRDGGFSSLRRLSTDEDLKNQD